MKKKTMTIIGIVLLIAAVAIIITVKQNTSSVKSSPQSSFESIEEANKAAVFNLEHSDRLCGYPATGYEANSSTIEVKFGTVGIIRKTLGVTDNSGNSSEYSETSEKEVNGKTVTLKGKDGKIYIATWNYNNFAYTISLDESTGGVPAEEMIEYIEATR